MPFQPPKTLENALYYDSNNNVTVRTDAQGGGGTASSVSVTNFPAVQTITGNVNTTVSLSSVAVSNFPATQNVQVTNFPAVQVEIGNVNVTSGSVSVSNFPTTQTVAGSVAVSNLPTTQTVNGNVNVTSGTMSVSNFPATQTVAGSVAVSNFPATQNVQVTNFPAVQVEIGNVNVTSGSVSISNFPSDPATGTNQTSQLTALNQIHTDLTTAPLPAGTNTLGNVNVNNFPSDPATGTNQTSQLTALNQIHTDLIAPLPPGTNYIGNVVVTNLTADPATGTNQASEIAALGQLHSDLIAPLPPGNNTIGNVIVNNFPATQTVTGSVSVSNLPATQTVAGNVNVTAGTVSISNFPSTLTDSTVLYSNAAISSTTTGAWLDTTGYGSISLQFVGIETAEIYVEGSNDAATPSTLLVLPLDDYNLVDVINKSGLYTLKVSARYIRFNIQNIIGSCGIYILGRNSAGPSAADAVSMAMNGEQNMPLNVNFKSGLKIDTASGALVLADSINPNPQGLMYQGSVNTITIIDTTGYNSLNITTMAYAGTVTASNDGITWVALGGLAITGTSTALVTAVTATSSFSFPCMARYVRFTCTTAGQFTVYLRQQLFSPNYLTNQTNNLTQIAGAAVSATTAQLGMNIVQVGGTATVTGGLAGTLGIGGASAVGVAPTYNFLGVSGIDTGGLSRRVLTDASGRLAITGTNPNISATSSPTSAAIGAVLGTLQNTAAMNVQDTAQFEGQSIVELLAQILLELRIANQQRYEMPYLLNTGQFAGMDPPEQFRNDATIFAQ